jgi:hypothetical protein
MDDLRRQTLVTARRLLKNQLRHLITSTKAEDDDVWSSVAFVDKSAAKSAQADWAKIRSAWAPGSREALTTLVLQALREAVNEVKDNHQEHLPGPWIDKIVGGYLETFQPDDIL